MQSLPTEYRLHIDLGINLLLGLHILHKSEIQASLKLVRWRFFATAVNDWKNNQLGRLRHSKSASDLQQCLYLIVKRK